MLFGAKKNRFDTLFDTGPIMLEVRSDNPDQVDCLNDYFGPYLKGGSSETKSKVARLHVSSSPAGYLRTVQLCSKAARVGTIEHHPDTRYEVFRLNRDSTAFLARTGYPHVIVRNSVNNFEVLHSSLKDPEGPKPALRLARELVVAEVEGETGATVHASSASIGGEGFLFVGDSGAGKTTCALATAFEREGAFVSGDRTIVKFDGTSTSLFGWPMAVNVGRSALMAILKPSAKDLPSKFRNSYFDEYHSSSSMQFSNEVGAKLALSPKEFESIGVKFCFDAPLSGVVFPKISPSEVPKILINRLSPIEAAKRFKAQLKIGVNSGHGYGLVRRQYCARSHEADTGRRVDKLLTSIPCMSLHLTHGALNRVFSGELKLTGALRRGMKDA